VGLHRMFDDALGPLTAYGRHLLHLGESREFFILNRVPCFPDSHFFTCWPHGGGASVVNYILSSHNLLPFVDKFYVSPIPRADHALLSLCLRADTPPPASPPNTIFRFDEGDPDTFSTHFRQMLPPETQFSLLDSASTKYNCLSSTIWDATLTSYTHSTQFTSTSQKNKSFPMNRCYDKECKALHCQLRCNTLVSPSL
jgi:hypothetical protein